MSVEGRLALSIRSLVACLVACATVLGCAATAWGAAGDLDTSFSTDGKDVQDLGSASDTLLVTDAVTDSSDRVVVVGIDTDTSKAMVVRYTASGLLDSTFDGDGIFTTPFTVDEVDGVAIDSQGRIVVGGAKNNDLLVGRLTPTGTPDPSFAGGLAIATIDFGGNFEAGGSVAVGAADSIVVAGRTSFSGTDWAVARLTSAGVLDTTFDTDGKQTIDMGATGIEAVTGVALDGASPVLGGYVGTAFGDADFAAARLTSAGALDTSFSTDGKDTLDLGMGGAHSQDFAQDVAMDGNKVVLGGSSGGTMAAVRYTSGGALDTGFDGDGIATASAGIFSQGQSVVVDGGSKVTVAGSSFGGGATTSARSASTPTARWIRDSTATAG